MPTSLSCPQCPPCGLPSERPSQFFTGWHPGAPLSHKFGTLAHSCVAFLHPHLYALVAHWFGVDGTECLFLSTISRVSLWSPL
ncbi:hypothetical protein DSO57_1011363 [Entomophthora muscae]|uniref:Uncharacterized protein n=1 Tax=Entomophthora muscae TaxID=34485 RepID=A0ACC2SV45_9FUNG|nr:hypothetical protein DSO57_1011363 [Entomophthora muscae]